MRILDRLLLDWFRGIGRCGHGGSGCIRIRAVYNGELWVGGGARVFRNSPDAYRGGGFRNSSRPRGRFVYAQWRIRPETVAPIAIEEAKEYIAGIHTSLFRTSLLCVSSASDGQWPGNGEILPR